MPMITAKIQICTSETDKNLLTEIMKAYSNACNMISSEIFLAKGI